VAHQPMCTTESLISVVAHVVLCATEIVKPIIRASGGGAHHISVAHVYLVRHKNTLFLWRTLFVAHAKLSTVLTYI
jgi:hypothetical protein